MAKEYLGQEYAIATKGKGLKQGTGWERFITRFTVTMSVIIILCSVAMVLCCFLVGLSPVEGTSMMCTINATVDENGKGVNTDTALNTVLIKPKRGDIIIAKMYLSSTNEYSLDSHGNMIISDYTKSRYPHATKNDRYMQIIKRLIAVSGDYITMKRELHFSADPRYDENYDYYIYVNGERLSENYLDPKVAPRNGENFIQLYRAIYTYDSPSILYQPDLSSWKDYPHEQCIKLINGERTLVVPDGAMFFMGDNRNGYDYYNQQTGVAGHSFPSYDCTKLGPQSSSHFISTVIDIVPNNTNMAGVVWNAVVYYVFFGWLWQK